MELTRSLVLSVVQASDCLVFMLWFNSTVGLNFVLLSSDNEFERKDNYFKLGI